MSKISPPAAPSNVPCDPTARRSVAVFGAGVAGLTVAHELVRLGYAVAVYETHSEAGGFFRSARLTKDANMPSEYSWHGMGPWYHNVFDLLQQIPFDETGSIFSRALSRPIDFGIFPNTGQARFYDKGPLSIPSMFGMSWLDFAGWFWLMLKTWTANRRSEIEYARLNAYAEWRAVLSSSAARTWRSCFGPWIGSDWTLVSLHTAGHFFRNQLVTRPAHPHPADRDGAAWTHQAADGWLLFRGPSSEYWFAPWVRHLTTAGVDFFWSSSLQKLQFDGETVVAAKLDSGAQVQADLYVLATNPFAAAQIVARSPQLQQQPPLCLLEPLIQDGPHVQVSLRIAFAEQIAFPRQRTAVVVADSEFNLTLFAQEQAWEPHVSLGEGVKSLWTVTSCVATVPGRVHRLQRKKPCPIF